MRDVRSPIRAARGLAGLVLAVVLFGYAAVLALPAVAGWHRYVIAGGSMEPSIPRGSIVYDDEVPVSQLRVGDVITFVAPGDARPVTHRIHAIGRDRSGARMFRTKGDANPTVDLRPVRFAAATQARVRHHLPYAGWPLLAIASPRVRLLVLGIPALLAALWVLASMWREGGELLSRREGPGADDDGDLDLEPVPA